MKKIAVILLSGMICFVNASYSQEYAPSTNDDNFYNFIRETQFSKAKRNENC